VKKHGVKTAPVIEPEPSDEAGRLIARVRTAQKTRRAIKCDMTMITSYTDANTTQEIKGNILIRKPGRFRVNYTEPQKQLLISNGRMLWVYTPIMNQVIKQDIKSAKLDTRFYIEFETSIDYYAKKSSCTLSEDENNYILTMVPKKGEAEFDGITAVIEKTTLIPVSMKMKFESTVVEVRFFNIVTYTAGEIAGIPELAVSRFNFKTPKGVEEIEASAMPEGAVK